MDRVVYYLPVIKTQHLKIIFFFAQMYSIMDLGHIISLTIISLSKIFHFQMFSVGVRISVLTI